MSFPASAHTVVLSEYTLSYEEDRWILRFVQRTRHLRDAIYDYRPDLKGINLNGESFLLATARHIQSNLQINSQGNFVEISPIQMQYGGLRFESSFELPDLPRNPKLITIQADGFDSHEHSIVLFRIQMGREAYLHHFNQVERTTSFDFEQKQYFLEDKKSEQAPPLVLFLVVFWHLMGWQ